MWRAIPQGPGLRWRHPGIFQTSCVFVAPIGPLADWADNPPTPPSTSSACTCSHDGVHSLLREHLALSLSHSLSFSHTHILTAVAAVIRTICPPSPPSPVFAFSGPSNLPLAAPRPPQSHFSTHKLLMVSHMRLSSTTHFLSGIAYMRDRCVFCRLAMSTMRLTPLLPSYTPR